MDYENKYIKYKLKYLHSVQKESTLHITKIENKSFLDNVEFDIDRYNKIYLII